MLNLAVAAVTALMAARSPRGMELGARFLGAYATSMSEYVERRSAAGRKAAETRWGDANSVRSGCDGPCDQGQSHHASHPERTAIARVIAPESHAEGSDYSSSDPDLFSDLSSPKSSIVSTASKLLPDQPGSIRSPRARGKTVDTAATWAAYSAAYVQRYGEDPVRNARVNAQMAQFVRRVRLEEAPAIAAAYVRSPNQFYVANGHSIGCLLKDAEKLRTEWATGRQTTSSAAQRIDRTQDRLNGYEAAKAQLRAEAEEEANHGR